MKSFPTLLVMLGLVFALCGAPAATQIQVPADFATIQAAIDAATAFDTVLVAPGTYVENLHIEGKSTRLASHYLLDGDPEHIRTTIIDGSNPAHPDSASVIRLVNAGDALVMGFTITGGKGTKWQDQADGHNYREGGGILTEGGQPRIYSNLIIANSASSKSGVTSAGGGGQ